MKDRWRVIDGYMDYGVQMGKDGGFMLHPDTPDAKAKANLIVLACNHHEELVNIIKDFLDAHITVAKRANFDGCRCEWCKAFQALLSKIEGERT